MSKKVLIIGAGFLQDFVIKKAKEMGYHTLTVDGDKNAIGFKSADLYEVIDITDKEKCLDFALRNEIDGVLTAATDYGVITAAYIAEKMHLNGISCKTAELIKNKYLVRKLLFSNKVDDSDQAYEVDCNTDIDKLAEIIKFPIMVKPCDGSGSRGASRVDDVKSLKDACSNAIKCSLVKKAEIESFVCGKEYGCESLVIKGGEIHVFPVMEKLMTKPPYYAELGHSIPSGLSVQTEEKIKDCVKRAIKVLGIDCGSVNMDLLVTDKGDVHIVDIGARMGGNMIGSFIVPYGSGIDYMGNMIKNALNESTDFSVEYHGSVATRLLAFSKGVVKKLPDFSKIENRNSVKIYHHLSVGQVIDGYHTNLDGCGYVVAVADDVTVAKRNVENALREITEIIF